MLYSLLKFPAKLAFYIYTRHISINKKEVFNYSGPMIIASNHPNSFLDAIIYATLFNKPVHSLARGDVFKGHFTGKFFTCLICFLCIVFRKELRTWNQITRLSKTVKKSSVEMESSLYSVKEVV